ncbi:hypothetical protein EVAR_42763_1 [Eumeta japonica]|uniref:Uncharacterized protein n=1 Tax=Eumeta variegata TaxID=151549 RepID=A0A4C1WM69_EUMVA|nr:hypothetical protein EVAR_42763_1 [Eumeta japonica]
MTNSTSPSAYQIAIIIMRVVPSAAALGGRRLAPSHLARVPPCQRTAADGGPFYYLQEYRHGHESMPTIKYLIIASSAAGDRYHKHFSGDSHKTKMNYVYS